MVVTFDCNAVQTRILHHRACHELRNRLLGKLFFLHVKFMKKR